MPRDIPLRKRLLTQLLAVSALVSLCSTAATAWLAAQTISGAFRHERGQVLSDNAKIYDALLGLAAESPDWRGADHEVRALASKTDRRIVLTTQDRKPIADSAARSGKTSPSVPDLPQEASAVVDPLAVDLTLIPGAASRIDPRAVGPFRLTATERRSLRAAADGQVRCMLKHHVEARVVVEAGGRPQVEATNDPYDIKSGLCDTRSLDDVTPTEARAITSLQQLTDACLRRRGTIGSVKLALDFRWNALGEQPLDDGDVKSCLTSARREQLGPYVSAPALLFILSADGSTIAPELTLTPSSSARPAAVALGILALTIGVTAFAAARLTRPLRALTAATQRMRTGEGPAPVLVPPSNRSAGEITRLTSAFNDMAQHRLALEEQRRAMVSDVAHELRTPLSNIRLWLQAAEDRIVPADPALISSVLEEALLLQHIINDLQDLAAADAGTLTLHLEPVLVAHSVYQAADMQRASAHAAGVRLTVTTDEKSRTCADPMRLRQMIGNLLSNAIRHTPPGGSVTVRSYETADHAVIEVADTGSGIPATDLPHVFERFWRADKSRTRGTGGSGLGLPIVRNLSTAHGGTVTATSTVGEGSVFTITLPRRAGAAGAGAEDTEH